MKQSLFISVMAVTFMSGCVHSHKVIGTQEPEQLPAGVKVQIGSKEIKEGQKVNVLTEVCTNKKRLRGGDIIECKSENRGEALVLKVLDHDLAIIEPLNGLVMDRSMKVEKQ